MTTAKPKTYSVLIQGYGGECFIGSVKRETYDFFKAKRIDLEQYISDWDDELFTDVPQKHRFITPGSQYDCDNLCHASGATMDESSYITVLDENYKTVWESILDIERLKKQGVEVVLGSDDFDCESVKPGKVVFWGGQGEKGCFFDAEFPITGSFDPTKLTIFYSNADGWLLSGGVAYDGEDLEGYDGYSTTGKWSEHKFWIGGDEEVYEGVERSEDDMPENDCESEQDSEDIEIPEGEEMWAQEVIDSHWNGIPYSIWQPGYLEPVHKGFYDVEYETASWPWANTDRVKWTGKKWQHNRNENTVVMRWRGLAEPAK